MKIRVVSKVMVLSCSLIAGGAYAAGPYIGADYTQFQYDNDHYDTNTLKINGAVVRAGVEFNDWIGLELRGGGGFDSASDHGLHYRLDDMYGGYLKLSAPLSDKVHPYIIGGYTHLDGKVTAYTTVSGIGYAATRKRHFGDESYGAGIDFNLTDTLGANLEYMRYYDKDHQKIAGISVGLRSAF